MSDRVLVLSADHYSIPDEKTGVVQDLFQVWFVSDYREDTATELGCKPIKMMTTPELFEKLRPHELPSVFDLELRSKPGKANTASLVVVGMSFVSTPALFSPVLPDVPVASRPTAKPVA